MADPPASPDPSASPGPALQAMEPEADLKLPFTLQGDETILLLARRHWLYFSLRLAFSLLALVLGLGVGIWAINAAGGFDGALGTGAVILTVLWTAFWGFRAYFQWYRYKNDLWAVTTQRLVDSTKKHWFHHEMASADLVDVEDIRVAKAGILPTTFNFGDVRCQTAGEVPNFVMGGVPNPTGTLAIVDSARDAARRALRGPG
jgi:hypothetical protein